MSVFDNTIRVKRRVPDPATDKTLSGSGALAYSSMTSVSGLAGCTGIDAQLIHGDRWTQVDKNHTEQISVNAKLTIGGNQTIMVGANQTETIGGTCNETIIGPHIIANMNVYNETRIGAHIQTHGGIEWVHDKENEWHYGGLQWTFYSIMHEIEIEHLELAAGHNEVKGQHNYFSVNDNSAVLFQFQTKALNAEADGMDAAIKGVQGDVKALQGKVGALEAKATAAIPTAGADVNPTPLL